jgi:hypothetical protein
MTMAKKIAALLLMCAGAPAAMAQDSLSGQLTACVAIPGVLQRLACYDRVAHSVSPAIAPRSVPAVAQKPVARAVPPAAYAPPPVAMAAPTGLGSERLPQTAAAQRNQELTATVTSVSYNPRGRFTVTLDNGEVWRQLEGDTSMLQGVRNATVRISRGSLGSYDLNVIGRNASYRVLRLQ